MVTLFGGLIGGLIATIAMTIVMMMVGDDSPPPTANLWSKYVGNGPPDDYMPQGMLLHFVYGIGAGAVFVLVAEALEYELVEYVPAILGGLGWGVVLAVVGMVFWMKLILDLDADPGMMGAFVVFHLVYGAVLGAVVAAGFVA